MKVISGDRAPGEIAPALDNKRVKRDIIRQEKKKLYPGGLGLAGTSLTARRVSFQADSILGVYQLYLDDQNVDVDERYVHRFVHDENGVFIVTGFKYSMELLDDPAVIAFEADTTYKRIELRLNQLSLNEWEVVLFEPGAERGMFLVFNSSESHSTIQHSPFSVFTSPERTQRPSSVLPTFCGR